MSSYQWRKSHCGDKTVVRSSYLHNEISYTGKMSYLYSIRAQAALTTQDIQPKIILNSHLLKFDSYRAPIAVVKLFWKFGQSTSQCKILNDLTTNQWIMGKRDFAQFDFKMSFERIPYIARAPSLRLEDGCSCPGTIPVPKTSVTTCDNEQFLMRSWDGHPTAVLLIFEFDLWQRWSVMHDPFAFSVNQNTIDLHCTYEKYVNHVYDYILFIHEHHPIICYFRAFVTDMCIRALVSQKNLRVVIEN